MPPRPRQPKRQLIWDWRPQPRQLDFLRAAGLASLWGYSNPPVADEILYGGSAGSGKSSGMTAACIARCFTVPNARVIYFRRSFPELAGPGGAIEYCLSILPERMSDGSPVYRYLKAERKIEFFNGSSLTFAHIQHEADKYNYKSMQVDLAAFDEVTSFTEGMYVYFALSRVRKWRPDLNCDPIVICGSNPGGVGHLFVRSRFVDPSPPGEVFMGDDERKRMFIPALLTDNKILMNTDPDYERKLKALPEADRKALLEGDWDSYAGQFFSEWSRRTHIIKPFEIPTHWPRTCAYDFGYGAAAVHLWFAVDPATSLAYCYREYVTAREVEVGKFESFKATIPVQARQILDKEREARDPAPERRVADPSIFDNTQANIGESMSETFSNIGIYFEKADNARVAGWQRMHAWLSPIVDERGAPIEDEHGPIAPLRFFDTCRYTAATIPALPHDLRKPEDVDTNAEDHAADATRYWVSSRPEPVNLTPFRFKGQKPVRRHRYPDEIEDELHEDTPLVDERGLLMPIVPRRKKL